MREIRVFFNAKWRRGYAKVRSKKSDRRSPPIRTFQDRGFFKEKRDVMGDVSGSAIAIKLEEILRLRRSYNSGFQWVLGHR